MNWWTRLWLNLLPITEDALIQNRAGLVIAMCILLSLIASLLIFFWWATGDLQHNTIYVFSIYILVFIGIGIAAHFSYWLLASWALIGLLTVTIAGDTFYFGVSSPAIVGYIIPILIASFNLGVITALLLTSFIALIIWFCAFAELTEWYNPQLSKKASHRTFNAPIITIVFFTVVIISSFGSQNLILTFS